ncbi:alcohol dehydrogenase catalytic domain-containing protein [Kocuria atrinae]|uniref:quinone oxidoreductase family protein n=1 Tax=Kocuria atrinae TaxID=592377 RepID=UPI0003186BC9|nr:alcohol dehydrogenase catalytic domain-containing protein [Kocuria atrinae]
MRIIGFTEFGGPEVLDIHDVPEPHAGPGEVRIAVKAAAVNPTDTETRQGNGAPAQLPAPHVPGMDAAGVIDEVGEPTAELDTSPWSVGDHVMAIAIPLRGHGGAYVEYLVADADSLARIPEGRSLEEASTLPMNGLTALQALEKLDLDPGQVLGVTGAAGTWVGTSFSWPSSRASR